MQFFPWRTSYEEYQSEVGRREAMSYVEHMMMSYRELDALWKYRIASENWWRQEGKPYYNIHPQLVPKLAKVNLDKIPGHLLQMPHDFKCVHIRFCQQHEELTFAGDAHSDESGSVGMKVSKGSFIRGMLMVDFRKGNPFPSFVHFKKCPQVLFIYDYSDLTGSDLTGYLGLYIEGNESLLQVLEKTASHITCANALKLAVTIGFLANSKSELIEYDVLSKFSREFASADEDRKQAIIDKSRKRGKVGYNVGNDLMFIGPQPSGGSSNAADERELQYAHIRTGHPHAVRYGLGHSLVKVMWFAPTVVRSDLPFKGEHS